MRCGKMSEPVLNTLDMWKFMVVHALLLYLIEETEFEALIVIGT